MTNLVALLCAGTGTALAAWLFRLRRELRGCRQALDTLTTQAPVGIMWADTQGLCTFANQVWHDLSGLGPAETLGHAWSRAIHPDDLPDVMREWEESVRAQRPYLKEARLVRPDGSQRTVLGSAAPVRDAAGGITGFIGTVLDITDSREAEREARRALADRERLLRTLIDVQEHEKQSLCHEFHDGLIQYAVGSKMLLESLRHAELDDATRPVVESVIEYLAKGIEDGRRVIRGIRPQVLDDLGLHAALDDLCAEVRGAGIGVDAVIDPAIDAVALPLQTTIYRVVQESFANARRHSGSARVRLAVSRDAGAVVVAVEDFGSGFDPDAAAGPAADDRDEHRGHGLLGIRERVRLAGGCFAIDAAPGCGTRLRAVLPVRSPDDGGDNDRDGGDAPPTTRLTPA